MLSISYPLLKDRFSEVKGGVIFDFFLFSPQIILSFNLPEIHDLDWLSHCMSVRWAALNAAHSEVSGYSLLWNFHGFLRSYIVLAMRLSAFSEEDRTDNEPNGPYLQYRVEVDLSGWW